MGQEVLEINREVRRKRAADYVELTRIHLLANSGDHLGIARLRNTSATVLDLLEKGAVSPIATTDPGAAALLTNLGESFLQSVGVFSAFQQILNAGGFRTTPLRTRIFAVTLAASGYTVSEADFKPVSKLSLAQSELQYWKSVGIAVLTAELMRSISTAAADFISNELGRAVGYATDARFTELLTGNTGSPSTPSTGVDAAAFLADLRAARRLISKGADARLFLIVPPTFNDELVLMRDNGGWIMLDSFIADTRVVCSDALAADTAILVDASQIAASSDVLTFNRSTNSSLMLDDDPTSPPHLTSLFQNNLVAAKAERYVGCEVTRDDCLCVITGISTTA